MGKSGIFAACAGLRPDSGRRPACGRPEPRNTAGGRGRIGAPNFSQIGLHRLKLYTLWFVVYWCAIEIFWCYEM